MRGGTFRVNVGPIPSDRGELEVYQDKKRSLSIELN